MLPFCSYYLTGFLNEKPLAALRMDMDELGIGRAEGVKDPEDQIASLCEMMAGMITGAFGEPVGLDRQRAFFDKHIGCWAPRFFKDLQAAESGPDAAPDSESPNPGDPVESTKISQVAPASASAPPAAGNLETKIEKPARGSALARRWGRSPDQG